MKVRLTLLILCLVFLAVVFHASGTFGLKWNSPAIPGKQSQSLQTGSQAIYSKQIQPQVNTKNILDKAPLYFIANQGQMDKQVIYYTRTSQYTLWLTKKELVFDSIKRNSPTPSHSNQPNQSNQTNQPNRQVQTPRSFKRDVSRLVFLNAMENPEMTIEKPTPYRVNYLNGKDKASYTNIPTSERYCTKNSTATSI